MDAKIQKSTMAFRWVHDAVTAIVRPASAVAFAGQLFVFALNWYGYFAGWRFNVSNIWFHFYLQSGGHLGLLFATIALACLMAFGSLALLRPYLREKRTTDAKWCLWLNIATIAMLCFVPAIAAA
jgi:hypothetical protein